MSADNPTTQAEPQLMDIPAAPHKDTQTLSIVALSLVIVAASWFLLQQLAALLRPLCLAVFLSYVILPIYHRFRRKVPGPTSFIVTAGSTLIILGLIVLLVQVSIVELSDDLPNLFKKGAEKTAQIERFLHQKVPWLGEGRPGESTGESAVQRKLRETANALVSIGANAVAEGLVVVVYLLFLLLEGNRLSDRVRTAFPTERANRILAVMERINHGIARYVKVKVKASLILAVPITLILWALGVKFALLWGLLTFFCNFIPYLGSVISTTPPLVLAYLDLGLGWQSITVVVLVIGMQMASAYFIEPTMTGKAVGLSPLIILASLSFWGLCWGLIGLFLAIPLTVILKIILDNIEFTRPLARLLGDE